MQKHTYNGLITCVMVTQPSRAELMRRALAAFRDQTWAARELVIVVDLRRTPDLDWWFSAQVQELLNRELPVYVKIVRDAELAMGDLRNIGVARGSGDFIATWDDDDISNPRRLETMHDTLMSAPKDVDGVALAHHFCAWPEKSKFWVSHERNWECTSLVKRHRIGVYPALNRNGSLGSGQTGSDSRMMKMLNMQPILHQPELYVRTFHGSNMWPESHFQGHFDRRTRDVRPEEVEFIQRMLEWK